MSTTDQSTNVRERSRPMTPEEKKVIMASSAGTIFEWYDFYLYGALAAIIGAQFFTAFPENTRNVFALLAFGQLFGFVGVLIALPASAVLLVAIRRLRHRYQSSELFRA